MLNQELLLKPVEVEELNLSVQAKNNSAGSDEVLEATLLGAPEMACLTGREKQILTLLIQGKTNKEIAHSLCRVERTVEYHRNNIMHKLNAHNVTELIKKAITMGLAVI